MQNQTKILLVVTTIFLSFYLFGWVFPDYWWSTHFIAFISPVWRLIILAFFIVFLCRFFFTSKKNDLEITPYTFNRKKIIIITLVYIVLILLFPMIKDFYGDSYKFNLFLDKIPPSIPKGTHEKFFNFKLTPWAGQDSILAVITYISYYFQVTYKTAFYIMNVVFGGFFIFTWLNFVNTRLKNDVWKIIMGLAGITAPFMLLFFGHIEIYAPILFFYLLWIVTALKFIKTEKKQTLWLLILLFFICLKLHLIAVLCIPAMFLLFWNHKKGKYLNWKQVSMGLIAPIFLIGIGLYFFVFKDHIDNRSLQGTAMEFDHLFLPLFSPEAPLDKYNLLSFHHIFDYFSLTLLWSPIALFLLVLVIILKRKIISWNSPEIIISGICLFLFTSFFFAINPLLSMPIDWDLFSIPAPFLLVFVTVLIGKSEHEFSPVRILLITKTLVLMTIPVFIVHVSGKSLSKRMESVGIHIYNTYYEWSAKTIDEALAFNDKYQANRLDRGEKVLLKLKSRAIKGIDYEYCTLLVDQGRYYLRIQNNPKKAITYLTTAQEYAPSNNAKLLLVEAYFVLEQYPEAYKISEELAQIQFPDFQKSYRTSLHCALEAGFYEDAKKISHEYFKNWPDDKAVQQIYQRLVKNDRINELKLLFKNIENQ